MNLRVPALLVLLLTAASCSSAKHYDMRGQILAVNRDKLEILVKHDDIEGLMPAMTMPWKVRTAGMLDNLGPGDLIASAIEVDGSQSVVTKITKVGTAKPDMPPAAAPATAGVKLWVPGDEIPNQVFVDQDGRRRTFDDIRGGRALAVTFIYTKCPIPTFCPMMDRQFAAAQSLIREKDLAGKAGLLSVSFDPKNDTPPMLKAHAQTLDADPKVWTFVTGDRDEIDRFATNFGLTLIRGEAPNPEEIGHTLRTALVDRHGRLVKTYSGADWTPHDLLADIQKLP
ncbi:MAG TPA: SCO family protein [Vicinamibacterales bacterium]|nr:SCO family protein [Vicinamibacterales bacterium]